MTDQEHASLKGFEEDASLEASIAAQQAALQVCREDHWRRVLECTAATETPDVLAQEKVPADGEREPRRSFLRSSALAIRMFWSAWEVRTMFV